MSLYWVCWYCIRHQSSCVNDASDRIHWFYSPGGILPMLSSFCILWNNYYFKKNQNCLLIFVISFALDEMSVLCVKKKHLNKHVCCYFLCFLNVYGAALPHMPDETPRAAFWKDLKKYTQTLWYPNMCASTHVLTSHHCVIIPKQTIINEPCDAYLSENEGDPPFSSAPGVRLP